MTQEVNSTQPHKLKLDLVCPKCGTVIEISGSMKAEPQKKHGHDQQLLKDILSIFTPAQQAKLEVSILEDGSFAKLEWKGKFDKAKWSKVNSEIRGFGGRFIKSHWMLPLAVFKEPKASKGFEGK